MDDQDEFYRRRHLEAQICLDKYKIEKNVSRDTKTDTSELKQFWEKLEVGDSFLVDHTKEFSLDVAEKIRIKVNNIYGKGNLKEVADALTDILYVTYGAGCAYGIDLDKCFDEVQKRRTTWKILVAKFR